MSGYLIVESQVRQSYSGESSLGKYLYDRTARVYISLIPSLIFVVVVDFFFQMHLEEKIDMVANYSSAKIFIENLLLIPSMPFGTLRPIWSLMYEWWIYLLFGGVFFFKTNKLIASLLVLVASYYTFIVNAGGEAGHIWIIWVLGGGCAYFQNKIRWNVLNQNALTVLFILLIAAAGLVYFYYKNAYNLFGGIFLGLSLFVLTNKANAFVRSLVLFRTLIRHLAGLSFTLYLTHYTTLIYTKKALNLNGWSGLIVGFAISSFVAFIIALFSEYKLIPFKKYLTGLAKKYTSASCH